MTYREYRLGDICRLVKGTFSSTKTLPGEYPLVVTAAQRRTADGFDLEGPAVCIPLISSTGHGDAALHRLHYQEGPFALANLLVALLPLPDSPVNAEYLYWYLTAKKDEILVPLMRGTANVSLKEKDIAEVYVPLPPLPEQQRIVARVKGLLDKVEEARLLREEVSRNVRELQQAIAYRTDLTVEQKLQAGWKQVTLTDILTPTSEREVVQANASYPNFGIYSFGRGLFEKQDISGMDTSATSLYRVRQGEFIYSRLFAFEGAYGIVDSRFDGYYVSNEYPTFAINADLAVPDFLRAYFSRPSLWPELSAGSKGLGDRRQRIQPPQLLSHQVLLPPLSDQRLIAAVASKQAASQTSADESLTAFQALPSAILAQAFAGAL